MAAKLSFNQPEQFTVLGECTNLHKQWEQYVKRFEYFMLAANVTKDEQKKNLLLHVAGSQVQDIFETLEDQGTTYQDALTALNDYFRPKKNIAFDRHLFRSAQQEAGETVDNFIVRLQKLSLSCEFGDVKNEMIRDQVVEKCQSNELRKKFLQERDLTLDKVQDLARTYELSKLQATEMAVNNNGNGFQSSFQSQSQSSGSNQQDVNRLSRRPVRTNRGRGFRPRPPQPKPQPPRNLHQPRTTPNCYRCGHTGHYGKDCKKSKGVVCYACGGHNHFARMCKTKSVNVVSGEHCESVDLRRENEVFTLEGKNNATISLAIEGKMVDILIDSGASVNVIDKKTFDQIANCKVKLQNSNLKIFPYGSNKPIQIIGKAFLNLTVDSRTHSVEFQVIRGQGKTLLGRKSATELGLLHIGLINSVGNPAESLECDEILRSFEDRFVGIGKLKDFQLKLHIDTSVTPVAQPLRRVPFKMRAKIENKIDELEKLDIIEKVQGPTPWTSNLVCIPKKDNDIRLCLDLRQANKAVQRERFPMPNIEDTLEQMNNSSVFSRLDLKQSFHQIELEESSRYITTFVCSKGLYRYKRLLFGVNSAPEMHQRIIQQLLQDIPNCRNIADDIIIHTDTTDSHKKVLTQVLTRLREKNLTLNKDKCEFFKTELKFMGHTLCKDGIKIDESKVQAVRDAKPPQNVSDILCKVHSKLCDNRKTAAKTDKKRYTVGMVRQTADVF